MTLLRVIILICFFTIILSQFFIDESTQRLPEDIRSDILIFGDIDNDNDIDVISINVNYYSTATILINNSGYYVSTDEFEIVSSCFGCLLVDLDNEGQLDLFCSSESSGASFLNNNGVLSLNDSFVSEIYPPVLFGSMDAGDLQGDGDIDICTGSSGPVEDDYNPGMFINLYNSFLSCQFYPFWLSMLLTTKINDFNQDGLLDIAGGYNTATSDGSWVSGTLFLLDNGSDYDFIQYEYPDSPMLISTYDYDYDGDIDVIGGNNFFSNDGNAGFSLMLENQYPVDARSPKCVGDLDGDNFIEVVTLDTINNNYFFEFLEYGDSVFTYSDLNWIADTLNWSGKLHLLDADSDGDLDMYIKGSYNTNDRLYINSFDNGGAVSITESSIESISPALADGVDSIQVLITVRDALLNPLLGRSVKLNVSGAGLIITQPLRLDGSGVTTDANGQVVGWIRSTSPGIKTVRATADDVYLTTQFSEVQFQAEPEPADVNGDDEIDILDIVRMVNIILGTSFPPTQYEQLSADLNTDEMIDIIDIVMVIDEILGGDSKWKKSFYIQFY